MALGGLLGFGIGLVLGYAQQSEWPSILWRAAVAAYLAGLLMRWWGSAWISALRQNHQERLAAAHAKPETKSSPAKL